MVMGLNITFPVVDDVTDNFFVKATKTTKDTLRSNLLLLLLTEKGERYYMPDFGTDLNKFIFDPKDDSTLKLIEENIKTTVKKYIPELIIKNVNFYLLEDESGIPINENEIQIEITFNYAGDLVSSNQSVIVSKTI